MNNISVIIRSRNEERFIGHCIQSVTDFIGKPEIVLVDNESTDDTIRIVNRFEYHNIEKMCIDKDNYSPGRALNMGIEKSVGDWIVILSAHCEITQLDLEKVKKCFLDDTVVAVWGKQIPIWQGKRATSRYMWANFGNEKKVNYFCESENRYFFHNAFSFFRGDYLRNNLFDNKWASKEDRYWVNKKIDEGSKIIYDPHQVVKHHYTQGGATWMGIG